MTTKRYKDLGLQLNGNSMFEITNYTTSEMHPILQAAITLIFFTNDPSLREEYNGMYNIIGHSNSSIENIEMEFADIGFRIYDILKETYPEITKVSIEPIVDRANIQISININTDTEYLSTILYKEEL